ncbi:MAG: 5'(3')-deoxyribonucleotidase [Saprospiraceae bacterium]|nr:5'(3')-deoxyribonucleotidase [Saprospiraceae bacterium]
MKRIALDMDEVMSDIYAKFLQYFERDLGWRPRKEEYWGRKIYELEGATHLRKYLHAAGFFSDVPPMPNSQKVVQALQQHYDIFVVTSATEFRNSLSDKWDWLQTHFPSIPWKNYVFCGDKSIIQADYMIDDHVSNLQQFKGTGVLYTATHNADCTDYVRVNNWLEVHQFFQQELANTNKIA